MKQLLILLKVIKITGKTIEDRTARSYTANNEIQNLPAYY